MSSLTRRPRAITLLAGAALLWLTAGAEAATFVYVANADSQDISVLELDRGQGQLKSVETVAVAGTVMPMAVSPDKRFLYAALRSQPFRVASFAIDGASGRLRKLGEAPLAGRPITSYAGASEAARTYRELAREVIDLGQA